MARPRKVPWIAVRIDLLSSSKLASLPGDTAMLGWVSVLLEAKTQRRMGVYETERHFRLVIGRFARHLNAYIRAGLLHRVDALCPRCSVDYPDLKGPELVVHDYRREQRDPTHAERQEEYEKRSPKGRQSDAETDGQRDAKADAKVTPDSRARATTVTVTKRREVSKGTKQARANGHPPGEPRLTAEQLEAWATFDKPEWRAFVAAWRDTRGFLWPPGGAPGDDDGESLRAGLYAIARDWPEQIGTWVMEAPGRRPYEVVGYVQKRYHEARAAAGDVADADEQQDTRWD